MQVDAKAPHKRWEGVAPGNAAATRAGSRAGVRGTAAPLRALASCRMRLPCALFRPQCCSSSSVAVASMPRVSSPVSSSTPAYCEKPNSRSSSRTSAKPPAPIGRKPSASPAPAGRRGTGASAPAGREPAASPGAAGWGLPAASVAALAAARLSDLVRMPYERLAHGTLCLRVWETGLEEA